MTDVRASSAKPRFEERVRERGWRPPLERSVVSDLAMTALERSAGASRRADA
jgi:hypothetical protein